MKIRKSTSWGHTRVNALGGITQRFRHDETGATAIEYALIAGIIGLTVIAAAQALGTILSGTYSDIDSDITAAT